MSLPKRFLPTWKGLYKREGFPIRQFGRVCRLVMSSGVNQEEEIKTYYKNPAFPEAFSGAQTFYRGLKKTGKFPKLSYQSLLTVLSSIPSYSIHVRRQKLKFFRHVNYDNLSVGVAMQADLAEFPSTKEGLKYAFIMIDVMDNYCYARELPNKSAEAIRRAFLTIQKKFRLYAIETLATDQGSEFKGNEAFFKKRNIKLIYLGRNTKAFKVIPCLRGQVFYN